MKRGNKGFTLIELLIVIAIIGILASIILVSLNSARGSSKDTRIVSDIRQLRTQIETDSVNNAYDPSFTAANTLTTGGNYDELTQDISNQGGVFNVVTNATAPFTSYALYGKLTNPPTTTYFCMDNTGAINTTATDNTGVACP